MTEDRNFSRRMALKKFSNTPPFNMKGTESKGKFQKRTSIPPKCGTEYDQFVKISLSMNPKSTTKNKSISAPNTKCKGPEAVMASFKKIEAKHNQSAPIVQNRKPVKLGKNIPNHTIMNTLLENLLDDDVTHNECGDNNNERKNNEITQEIKKIPPITKKRSQNTISNSMNKYITNSHEVQIKNCANNCTQKKIFHNDYQKPTESTAVKKIDQKTSTTGLHWEPEKPVRRNYKRPIQNMHQINSRNSQGNNQSHCRRNQGEKERLGHFTSCNAQRLASQQVSSTKPTNKKIYQIEQDPIKALESYSQTSIIQYVNPNIYHSQSSEFELPTKDIDARRKKSMKKIPPKPPQVKHDVHRKTSEVCLAEKVEEIKAKELAKNKSFVRGQIEKYANRFSPKKRKEKPSNKSSQLTKQQINKNFDQMIKCIQHKIASMPPPKIDRQETDSHEWSDNVEECNITFPKETREAMNRLIEKTKNSVESKKNNQEISQPQEKYLGMKTNCRKLSVLPCHKNLLNRKANPIECIR